MNNRDLKEEMDAVGLLASAVSHNLKDIDQNTDPADRTRLQANRIDLRRIVEPLLKGRSSRTAMPPQEVFHGSIAEGIYRPPPPPPEQIPSPPKDDRQLEFAFVNNSAPTSTYFDQKADAVLAELKGIRSLLTKILDNLEEDETKRIP